SGFETVYGRAEGVPEVGALGALVGLVEADGVQHARELVVEVPGVQLVALGPALGEQRAEVELTGLRRLRRGLRGGHAWCSCGCGGWGGVDGRAFVRSACRSAGPAARFSCCAAGPAARRSVRTARLAPLRPA